MRIGLVPSCNLEKGRLAFDRKDRFKVQQHKCNAGNLTEVFCTSYRVKIDLIGNERDAANILVPDTTNDIRLWSNSQW